MKSYEKSSKPFWKQPESRRLEFKEAFPKGDQIAKTAIAFANCGGGKIIFGVQDNPRSLTGISDNEIFPLEERITDCIFSQCAPNIVPEISIQSAEGKNLLTAEIFPGSHKPYYLKDKGKHQGTYIRVGSSNRLAASETLEELERQRRNISFDLVPVYDLEWQDIDLTGFLSDFKAFAGKELNITQLENLGLMIRERDRMLPSHAAILLADPRIRKKILPFAKVECARFKGITMNVFLDQASIDLPVHKVPEACMAFIKRNIALGATIGEIYRHDRWEYPLAAIREAVINAVVHRDYSQTGSDIKIAIYDDMLEITSPGTLPDTLSIEELGSGRSVIRNRLLAMIFKDMGLIEAWGSGMMKIREQMKDYPEIAADFLEPGYVFQVQFIKRDYQASNQDPDKYRTSTGQAPDKLDLLEFCEDERTIKEMMAFLKLKHRETFTHNYLRPLMNEYFITMTIPDKPNSPNQKYQTTSEGVKALEAEAQAKEFCRFSYN